MAYFWGSTGLKYVYLHPVSALGNRKNTLIKNPQLRDIGCYMYLFRDLYEDSRFFMGRYTRTETMFRCWRDLFSSRKLLAKKLASSMLPGLKINFSPWKMRGYYGVRWRRLKKPVGPGQQFFPDTKMTLKTPRLAETRRRAWAPQRSPLKSECLMVTILPVWHKNWKMFSSYRLT